MRQPNLIDVSKFFHLAFFAGNIPLIMNAIQDLRLHGGGFPL